MSVSVAFGDFIHSGFLSLYVILVASSLFFCILILFSHSQCELFILELGNFVSYHVLTDFKRVHSHIRRTRKKNKTEKNYYNLAPLFTYMISLCLSV